MQPQPCNCPHPRTAARGELEGRHAGPAYTMHVTTFHDDARHVLWARDHRPELKIAVDGEEDKPVPIMTFFCSHGCCTTMTLVVSAILPPSGSVEQTHTLGGLEQPSHRGLVEQWSVAGPPIQRSSAHTAGPVRSTRRHRFRGNQCRSQAGGHLSDGISQRSSLVLLHEEGVASV